MAIKLICGSFLVVLLLSCLADTRSIAPNDPYNPGGGGQSKTRFDPEFRTCEVARENRISCGEAGLTQNQCENLECCYDSGACYFGKVATLHCTKNADIILVVARDATVPSINLETVSLMGDESSSCNPQTNPEFIVYQFNPQECGTEVTDAEDGWLVYHNKLSSTFDVLSSPLGQITRDTHFEVDFQCRYKGVDVKAVFPKSLTLPDPVPFATFGNLNVELRLGNGQCLSKGCVEDDMAYNSFYSMNEYPVQKVLRENVYVDVRILDRSDPDLHLQLGDCWVTTEENAYSPHRWDLLRGGCPNPDDTHPTRLLNVQHDTVVHPTHHRRFAFKMFTFVNRAVSDPGKKNNPYNSETVEPLREHLYIHCDCSVCVPSATDNCDYACYSRKKRDTATAKMAYRKETVLVSGPSLVLNVEV